MGLFWVELGKRERESRAKREKGGERGERKYIWKAIVIVYIYIVIVVFLYMHSIR